MRPRILPIPLILFFFLLLAGLPALSQYKIRGTVYDSTRTYGLELVSVLSTSGTGAVTNANGEYEISVGEKDSIWFSYLNKPTIKFPVLKITTPFNFDISLQVNVPLLREVKIRQRNYKQDSLQNREDYAKIFNYKKPGLAVATPRYGEAAGFDVNQLINIFRFKKNRSMLSFQRRLITQEQEKFVDHRFNKGLVRRLTGLTEPAIDSFMLVFRPPYEFTMLTGEYDFQVYIRDAFDRFKNGLPPLPFYRLEDEYDQ